MTWIGFTILLCVATVLQTTLAPFIAVHSIRPELMVIVAVHYALAARTYDALLSCWLIGLVMDLASADYHTHANVGVHALSLGLIGLGVVGLRSFTFRDSIMTQLVFTFLATLVLLTLVGTHLLLVTGNLNWSRIGEVTAIAVYSAIYTSVLAPYGHWILRRLRAVLGLGPTHRLRVR